MHRCPGAVEFGMLLLLTDDALARVLNALDFIAAVRLATTSRALRVAVDQLPTMLTKRVANGLAADLRGYFTARGSRVREFREMQYWNARFFDGIRPRLQTIVLTTPLSVIRLRDDSGNLVSIKFAQWSNELVVRLGVTVVADAIVPTDIIVKMDVETESAGTLIDGRILLAPRYDDGIFALLVGRVL